MGINITIANIVPHCMREYMALSLMLEASTPPALCLMRFFLHDNC